MSSQDIEATLQEYRDELLGYHKMMYKFQQIADPREILLVLSGYSARASWIRFTIIKSPHQKVIRFRIDELDPFLVEIDRQFKIWSRISAIVKDEYDMSKGQ